MRNAAESPALDSWDSQTSLLAWLATCVSVIAFLYCYRHAEILLYGDAVAHINIARRVFDSKTPGLLQLGTVWLPLPHLLIIPFVISKQMWQTGAGGSIPSMTAFVFAIVGIFRLTRNTLSSTRTPEVAASVAGWVAAAIFAGNPNLIYMQSTAMGESLYLAFFLWAVVYFADAMRGEQRALTKSGLCLAAACLTRYDGWFLAALMAGIALLASFFRSQSDPQSGGWTFSRTQAIRFALIAAAAPALWFAYNGAVYGNPLEFENGPYSAKAIERRTQNASNPGHPGSGNVLLAGLYFVKSGEDNVAQNEWLQRAWILLTFAALVLAGYAAVRKRTQPRLADALGPFWWSFMSRPLLVLLLLLVPVPFYALSVAYGGVPIFVPQWWPFTHYNGRYGLQLLPAFAFGLALALYLLWRATENRKVHLGGSLAWIALIAASYATVWRATPVCLAEGQINMRTRNQLEGDLATWVEKLPSNTTVLMYLGDFVGALERAGFPLDHTINEGDHRTWKRPTDPDGLWERALADPSKYADYVLAFQGDPVWNAVHDRHLPEVVEIHVSGQPLAILYRAR
jgi:hypothetical protein